ncbi:MAG TPA: hypothetical protein VK827_01760 [Lysobacter sp.]|nr:hypothetical protein [Lysobacter sp.]
MNACYNGITAVLFGTLILGLLAWWLKQPVFIACILIGMVAGPEVLDRVSHRDGVPGARCRARVEPIAWLQKADGASPRGPVTRWRVGCAPGQGQVTTCVA